MLSRFAASRPILSSLLILVLAKIWFIVALVSALTAGAVAPASESIPAHQAMRSAIYSVLATVPLALYGLYLLRPLRSIDAGRTWPSAALRSSVLPSVRL